MAQLSFYSADASQPRVADLAGVLCAHGSIVSFASSAARLSVAVDEPWRATALREEFAVRGVTTTLTTADCGSPLVRTAFRSDLLWLATAWTSDGAKRVPDDFLLTGAVLRLWALAAGVRERHEGKRRTGFLLGLDPDEQGTHQPLLRALRQAGLLSVSGTGSVVGVRTDSPSVRITGRARLRRLVELVGDAPIAAEPAWPASLGAVSA
ncbi:hypothetical protein [Haloechinothrix halophila]|uniref:hypothetical protein n=1 Tax=Haloechinothrix halophila TaxID=1069073 RepID=UPI0005568CE4|nr:hypothetical protein [Haloechinothrix halophila]